MLDATRGVRVNKENWDKFVQSQEPSTHIEDRRTEDDLKAEDIRNRYENWIQEKFSSPSSKAYKERPSYDEVQWLKRHDNKKEDEKIQLQLETTPALVGKIPLPKPKPKFRPQE